MKASGDSEVFQRIATGIEHVLLDIHPECKEYIDDDGRPHGQAGDINEILTYGHRGDAQDLTDAGTDAENTSFDKILDVVHNLKIKEVDDCIKNYWRAGQIVLILRNLRK